MVTSAEVLSFNAPGVVASPGVRVALMADPQIAALRAQWPLLTTLLVGIGSVHPSELLASSGNAPRDDDPEALARRGAVGDVCLHFLDASRERVQTELAGRTLGIDETILKAVPRRIAVAGGRREVAAIRAAVLGGWCDGLITDSTTAQTLLE